MSEASIKERYPILSLRIKPEQMAYLRRESDERSITLADYVRAVLFPFDLSDGKK